MISRRVSRRAFLAGSVLAIAGGGAALAAPPKPAPTRKPKPTPTPGPTSTPSPVSGSHVRMLPFMLPR